MQKEMCTDSALLDSFSSDAVDAERMLKYKIFAAAFSYPDEKFFTSFPHLVLEKEELLSRYDRIFRAGEVWLYGTEHLEKNEFQRSYALSDIMGFYSAFGLQPEKDRPDAVSCELEFMHYLIFKKLHVYKIKKDIRSADELASLCLEAQKKFFTTHLYPALKSIAQAIIAKAAGTFYAEFARDMSDFLEKEKKMLGS